MARHERLWDNSDGFDPGRWVTENGKALLREALIPFFHRHPRMHRGGVRDGRGGAFLAMLVRAFRFEAVYDRAPLPVAYLTVRAKDGIWLEVRRR